MKDKATRFSKVSPSYRAVVRRDLDHLVKELRSMREARGFSQESLAEKIGVAVGHIQSIEQNRRLPSLPMLLFIARVLGGQVAIKIEK